VDIGAYEFSSPASTTSYAWLLQFNLPIYPATDTATRTAMAWTTTMNGSLALSHQCVFVPPRLTLIPYGANVILTCRPMPSVSFCSPHQPGFPAVLEHQFPAPVRHRRAEHCHQSHHRPAAFYRLVH